MGTLRREAENTSGRSYTIVTEPERDLRIAPDGESTRQVGGGQSHVRFQVAMSDPAAAKRIFEDVVRFPEAFFHIARRNPDCPADVVLHMVMEARGTRLHRFFRREDSRKRLLPHINEIQSFPGPILVHSN